MQTTPKLKAIVEAIATAHGLDLQLPEQAIRLELPGYMPLCIETLGRGHLSVAHYYRQNGDTIADPDVELAITPAGWVPAAYQQPLGYWCYVERSGGRLKLLDARGQRLCAEFCEFWAGNLEAQGWLTRATRSGAPPAQFAV